MDQITQDYEKLFRENQDLKDQLEQVNKNVAHYQEIEEVLKNTMILAQKNAEYQAEYGKGSTIADR